MTNDSRFRLGIVEMDRQHSHWMELVEDFRAVAGGHLLEPVALQAARETLEKLLNYTKMHFASEEQFMADHRFPDLAAHKERHRELTAKLIELRDEIDGHSGNKTPLKLHLLVTIWLFEHIAQEDDQYARYILGKGGVKSSDKTPALVD